MDRRRRKEIYACLPNPSEVASSSSSSAASASGLEAHREHSLVADSPSTGVGQPKQLDLEPGTAAIAPEDVDLIPEETEKAGAGVGGPN
jgi:hypothetical protein